MSNVWQRLRAAALAGVLGAALACGGASDGVGGPSGESPTAGGDDGVGGTTAQALLGEWRLVALEPSDAPAWAPPAGRFTAAFRADGRLEARVDCNSCSGTYSAGPATLATSPLMACTRAYCVETAPHDAAFASLLLAARSWQVGSGMLELRSDEGVLRFER